MPYLGTLVEWNDQRGFGFVQADQGGDRLFVHISAFQPQPTPQTRPYVGQRLEFAVGMEQGKKRAQQVVWRHGVRTASAKASRRTTAAVPAQQGRGRREAARSYAAAGTYLSIAAFIAVFLLVAWLWSVPRWVASLYVVMSAITFFAYWKDKVAAQVGRWRTPESTLHSLALLGGWPGAILAQQWLRHKSSKAQFQWVCGVTVVLNVAAFVWLHSPWGRDWLPTVQV